MTYQQAQQVEEGDKVRTVYGDVGEVIHFEDTGLSRIFTVFLGSRAITVHSSKCYRVEG